MKNRSKLASTVYLGLLVTASSTPVAPLAPLLAAPRLTKRLIRAQGTALPLRTSYQKYSSLGPSGQAAAHLKDSPPAGWIRHYLPDDRYKIAGDVWKAVSTEYDTYFHRPSCPHILRQSPDNVLGFASAKDAMEAGYRPDPACNSAAAPEITTQWPPSRETAVRNALANLKQQQKPDVPATEAERRYLVQWEQYKHDLQEWSDGNREASSDYPARFKAIQLKRARGEKPTDEELRALAKADRRRRTSWASMPRQPEMPRSMSERMRRNFSVGAVMSSYRRRR